MPHYPLVITRAIIICIMTRLQYYQMTCQSIWTVMTDHY